MKKQVFRIGILIESILLVILAVYMLFFKEASQNAMVHIQREEGKDGKKDFIKWVDFDVSYEALCQAYQLDVESHEEEHPLNWIELLAYTAVKNGGKFSASESREMNKAADMIASGEATMADLTKDLKYYDYYLEAYTAVLGGYVGEYETQVQAEDGSVQWVKQYGLKAFSPIAKGFPYNDYDDFGSSRSYGYSRPHLGHDMMGQVGTPIGI